MGKQVSSKTHFKNKKTMFEQNYLGLVVLESVCFIYNETGPLNGAQYRLINSNQFI